MGTDVYTAPCGAEDHHTAPGTPSALQAPTGRSPEERVHVHTGPIHFTVQRKPAQQHKTTRLHSKLSHMATCFQKHLSLN